MTINYDGDEDILYVTFDIGSKPNYREKVDDILTLDRVRKEGEITGYSLRNFEETLVGTIIDQEAKELKEAAIVHQETIKKIVRSDQAKNELVNKYASEATRKKIAEIDDESLEGMIMLTESSLKVMKEEWKRRSEKILDKYNSNKETNP